MKTFAVIFLDEKVAGKGQHKNRNLNFHSPTYWQHAISGVNVLSIFFCLLKLVGNFIVKCPLDGLFCFLFLVLGLVVVSYHEFWLLIINKNSYVGILSG